MADEPPLDPGGRWWTIALGVFIIAVNCSLLVSNVVRGGWWYTPINLCGMGVVMWSLYRKRHA